MNCPYAYEDKKDNYTRPIIYCKKINDVCGHIRWCNNNQSIILSEDAEFCTIRKSIDIPANASKVRKKISNEKFLYVDIDVNNDGNLYTYKLLNPFNKIPDFVYVEKNNNDENGYSIIKD